MKLWEARNANVAEFIGVCIEPENIFIATAFCLKRSLQVILLLIVQYISIQKFVCPASLTQASSISIRKGFTIYTVAILKY